MHIAESFGDLLEIMSYMLIFSPKFNNDIFCRGRDIETSFYVLNESLSIMRTKLGEGLYHRLIEMSDQMRACFEADPERVTGETRRGKNLVLEAEELIKARWAERRPKRRPSLII